MDSNFEKEMMYQVTMSRAKRLREKGLLSDKEYVEIDTIFANKYGQSLCTLFTDINLIKLESRANM